MQAEYTDFKFEKISPALFVCVSSDHRFGTDAFLLASFAKARHKDSVIDFCSGNGIVAILEEKYYSPQSITAIELQDKAFCQLEATKEKSRLSKLTCIHADIRGFKPDKEVDLITCNPPYKTAGSGIKSKSTSDKITRHETECTADDVCAAAARSLKFGGRLCLCNRPERLSDVLCSMRAHGIEPKRLRFASKTQNDPPWLFLCEGRKGGGSFMTVERGLYMYTDSGELTDEIRALYSETASPRR